MNKRLKARIFTVYGTQGRFCDENGIDETYVSKVIQGHRILSKEAQVKWAVILDCDVNDIFESEVTAQ